MGSARAVYVGVFDENEFDDAAIFDRSSDEEDDDGGHPFENKAEVLKNLKLGYSYNKNGPAREYQWTPSEVSEMADLLRHKNDTVRQQRKKRPRAIRAQNYRGDTSNNYLINWINSVRSGKRFENNPNHVRGPKLLHGQFSNHCLWEFVSDVLTQEFQYWMKIHKNNLSLPESQRSKVKYPLIEDLIFRVNDDFTGGLWSQFFKYWEPFINELRLVLPLTIVFDNFILVTTKVT